MSDSPRTALIQGVQSLILKMSDKKTQVNGSVGDGAKRITVPEHAVYRSLVDTPYRGVAKK